MSGQHQYLPYNPPTLTRGLAICTEIAIAWCQLIDRFKVCLHGRQSCDKSSPSTPTSSNPAALPIPESQQALLHGCQCHSEPFAREWQNEGWPAYLPTVNIVHRCKGCIGGLTNTSVLYPKPGVLVYTFTAAAGWLGTECSEVPALSFADPCAPHQAKRAASRTISHLSGKVCCCNILESPGLA